MVGRRNGGQHPSRNARFGIGAAGFIHLQSGAFFDGARTVNIKRFRGRSISVNRRVAIVMTIGINPHAELKSDRPRQDPDELTLWQGT